MQPPLQITTNPSVNWLILVVGSLVLLYWLRALRLAREGARLFLRNLAFAIVAFIACDMLLTGIKVQASGSTTSDNLRVVSKQTNLKKSAKRPRLRDM